MGDTFEIRNQSQEGKVSEIYTHPAVVIKIRVFWDIKPIDS